ncbi:MAG: S8 family serine peptidase [Sphingomicrobium sp.]
MSLLKILWRPFALCVAVLAALQPAYARESPIAPPNREILVMVRISPNHYRPNGEYGGGYDDRMASGARQHLARHIARQYGLRLVDNWPMPMIEVDCFVMVVPEGRSTTSVAGQVSRDTNVAWAQPMELFSARAASHNDPLYAAEPAAAQWHLADLHRIATGRGIKVAVIDSGIEASHPDLAGQILMSRNFVAGRSAAAEQHGTGVAGIIAAKADNGIGIAGVAPGARLLGLRACWQTPNATLCDTLSLAKAIYFAVDQRSDVINLSLSGPEDRLLAELLKTALKRGAAIVTAFDQKLADGGFPASMRGVIAVSDTPLARSRDEVYIAPGQDVPTTVPGGRWFLVNGSSFAAAHVSGLIALMRERRRSASPVLISQRRGGGVIDACATLAKAAGACDCSCGPTHFASGRR